MESLNEEARRRVVFTFFKNNVHYGKRYTVQNFKTMNICPITTYRILQRLDDNSTAQWKSGNRGANEIMNDNQLRALKSITLNRVGVSLQRLVSRFKVNKSTISREFKRMGATCRDRTKVPLYTPEQLARAEERSKTLAVDLKNTTLIMDDESYFSMKDDRLPGSTR
jgi:AraC-like DNA-binding protein